MLLFFFVTLIGAVATYAYLLNQRGVVNEPDFVFTWGSDEQNIVEGTFRLEIWLTLDGENLTLKIKTNDDEYNEYDYVGLVFDSNQNGYIDLKDESYGLWANNMTAPSFLSNHGFLGFAETSPQRGPQEVTFKADVGYTFEIQFPYLWYGYQLNPAQALEKGRDNSLHVCFYDEDASHSTLGVFVRFQFYIRDI